MNVKVKSEVNARNLVMWSLTEGQEGDTCETAVEFGERLKNFSDTLTSNSQSAAADGVVVETFTGIGTGTLTLGLSDLIPDERKMMFGETVNTHTDGNVIVTTGKEKIPCVRAALMTDRSDGKVNLYKFFKVKFAPGEKSVEQINESGQATFTTISISGTYFQCHSEKIDGLKAEAKAVDPTSVGGKTFIQKWFSDADFIGDDDP